jgi:ferritin-like metal-binding protein YciE
MMRQYEHKSASTIEREVAAHRADIADTVAELKERLSPGELLDGILRDSRTREIVSRIAPAIGRNPLPAVLIGIGALWLALESGRAERSPAPRSLRTAPVSRAPMPVGKEALMAVSRENLTAWLRDAYAMEHQAIEILEKQANRLESYPELRAKVRSHLDESHRHAERVERCLHQLGTDTSVLKTALGKMAGTAQQLSGLFASDEVLKSGIADYAFEHYEIASYKTLIAAAAEAGEDQVGTILEENLREEEEMAAWLAWHLPEVTRQYLQREAAGQTAKV